MSRVLAASMHAGLPLVLALLVGWASIAGGGDKAVVFVYPLTLWIAAYLVLLAWRRRLATAAARWAWGSAGIATVVLVLFWIIAVIVLFALGL